MKLKEQYKELVKTIKSRSKEGGIRLRNEDIAKRMGYNSNYFSTLTGESGTVTQQHIDVLKTYFQDELAGIIKPASSGDPVNRERAIIKMLYQRLAKSESERLGIPIEKVMDEMDRDTMIAWRDLESEDKGKH
ncbi:hypothetical protein SAMN05428988_0105 [Chitinophaga sp. YR573]|uniref:hypothetical protein n=1 Tax=Chitinophaga sp. YR573 TaxID=1881040 RepID=UPI0008C2461F|nr:hypothetical protein [Chitinophaga sp. YR573]SEV88430.1 hypothetical protein SAMN05428988_0105 [Chitinophaga sp. YR573]